MNFLKCIALLADERDSKNAALCETEPGAGIAFVWRGVTGGSSTTSLGTLLCRLNGLEKKDIASDLAARVTV